MVGWIPRVNGNSPGNPSFDAGSQPARSSGVTASRVVLTVIKVGRSTGAGDGEIVLRPCGPMRDRAAECRNQAAWVKCREISWRNAGCGGESGTILEPFCPSCSGRRAGGALALTAHFRDTVRFRVI